MLDRPLVDGESRRRYAWEEIVRSRYRLRRLLEAVWPIADLGGVIVLLDPDWEFYDDVATYVDSLAQTRPAVFRLTWNSSLQAPLSDAQLQTSKEVESLRLLVAAIAKKNGPP